MAGAFYKRMVDDNETDPDPKGILRGQVAMDSFLAGHPSTRVSRGSNSAIVEQQLHQRRRREVENFLDRQGLKVTSDEVDLVLKAVNMAIFEARKRLVASSEFDCSPDTVRARFPDWVPPEERFAEPGQPVPVKYDILKIFDQMNRERGHAAATRDRWSPILERVAEEVRDIRLITPDWCVAWKDRLVASGLSTRTIQQANLAALRNVCAFAVSNRRIASNPMMGVGIKIIAPARLRPTKGYTDEEAQIVLKATLERQSDRLPVDQQAARRWIPWVTAYTGARVGEIAQLRKQDLHQRDGVWLLWITPEAGGVKDHQARYVAVHPHLVDMGFIGFVLSCPRDTLFYDPGRRRVEKPKNPGWVKAAENIAKWVRKLGVTDPQLQPNHGWRHRFKTVARKVRMDPGTRDYMQGQVPHNEAEEYGDFPAEVLFAELNNRTRLGEWVSSK